MRVISLTLLMVPMLLASCAKAAAPDAASLQWATQTDPSGFSVEVPQGWHVAHGDEGIRISSSNPAIFVLVAPFFARGLVSSTQFMNAVPGVLPQALPNAKVANVAQVKETPDEAKAVISFGTGQTAVALCSIYGRSGMLYAIAAPSDQIAAKKATLLRVLSSFKFTGSTQAHNDAAFEKWTDPKEDGFTVEIPKGWTADGGTFRFAPVDVRPRVVILSPDKKIGIRIGDENIPPHVLPNNMLAMAGLREGMTYSPGYGVNMLISRYYTGSQFARSYAGSMGQRGYMDVQVSGVRDLPEASAGLNKMYAQFGENMPTELTVGTASVSAKRDGEPYAGEYVAGTFRSETGGSGVWAVLQLAGYMAPADRQGEAQAALGHALQTFHLNDEWVKMQQGVSMNTSRIVTETNHAIMGIIHDTHANAVRVNDEISRKRENYILGLTDVRDPDTGETYKVSAGSNYYWRKGNEVVGTDTYQRPNTDFTPLQQW
jgi:hypothetical protein